MNYTLIILVVTVAVSFLSFNNRNLENKLVFYPYIMKSPNEYYRFISSGFIHADLTHLLFNMFTLYFIGNYVELAYQYFVGPWQFVALYLLGIIVANIPSFVKHKNHNGYTSLGASGGVAAVLFAMVYFGPWDTLLVMFIPMPAILFAVLYLGYSIYMSKKGGGQINHDAHLWGSIFGFVFTFLMDPGKGSLFLEKILHPNF